jgi:hypothetical protein
MVDMFLCRNLSQARQPRQSLPLEGTRVKSPAIRCGTARRVVTSTDYLFRHVTIAECIFGPVFGIKAERNDAG